MSGLGETPVDKTPIWSWFLLIPGLVVLVFVLSMLGGTMILPAAAWSDGMIWGGITALSYFGLLWLSRARSELVLPITGVFFVTLCICSQVVFLDDRVSTLQKVLHSDENGYPSDWQALNRQDAYQEYIRWLLQEEDASGWLDHLRAHSAAGIESVERQPRTQFTRVERQGWGIWLGWLACYGFLFVGCFLGMAGGVPTQRADETNEDSLQSPITESQPRSREQEIEEVAETNPELGSVIRFATDFVEEQNAHRNEPITPYQVTHARGDLSQQDALLVSQDLTMMRQLIFSDKSLKVDSDRLSRISHINETLYGIPVRSISDLNHRHLALLVDDRLTKASKEFDYEHFRHTNESLLKPLKLGTTLRPFASIDLSSITYRSVTLGQTYQDLMFLDRIDHEGTSWQLLEGKEPKDIPEAAYIGIIGQMFVDKKPRSIRELQEMGVVFEHQIIEQIGPPMKDAILTVIREQETFGLKLTTDQIEGLLGYLAPCDFSEVAPVMERCIRAGRLKPLEMLPETPEWQEFLDEFFPGPFSYPDLNWYKRHLREQGFRA